MTPPAPAAERRFCRLSTERGVAEGYWPLPPNGLCLSAFVLLSPAGRPGEVLLGRLDPSADWANLGALDAERARRFASGWMIPSSHLLEFEAPSAAARRILEEQLGLPSVVLAPPIVVSEAYAPPRAPHAGDHWDLEFLFRAPLPPGPPPRHPAWRELAIVEPARTPAGAFVRSHHEVLAAAGYRIG